MKLKKGFELRNVCGENVILATGAEHIDFSKMISTNESAAFLWQTVVDKDFDADTLAHLLCQEYEVTPEVAKIDCEKIIEDWKQCGLIE